MNVFVSYRRAEQDVGIAAFSLSQVLKRRGWTVFMDLQIPPLANWKNILRDAVAQSTIMIVAMGPRWLGLLHERRDSGEADWVRFEIAAALARNIPVGAVLFGDTKSPSEQDLPEEIRGLADHQAVKLSTSSPKEFDRDCKSFVADLGKQYGKLAMERVGKERQRTTVNEGILRPSPGVQIENTSWRWPGSGTVTFAAGGKAIFSDSPYGGYWELKGNRLQFDSNRFTMFDVTVSGDLMEGEWYRINDPSTRSGTSLQRIG
jgi:hypothetical protein